MAARVLVVEDEESLSELLSYNLSREGYNVGVSSDGEDALISIDEQKPDLIILDWMLPKVSGIEIARQLRARAQTREIPIIILSARGSEEDRVRGLEIGADDYLTKPFSMTELVARIRAVLRRTRPT
ncbi:MAG: response regulator, partial [Pseudomonadota bacterium]